MEQIIFCFLRFQIFFFCCNQGNWCKKVLGYIYFAITLHISPSVPSHSHTLLLLFFSFSNLLIFAVPALWTFSQVAQKNHYLCIVPLRAGHDAFHGLQVSSFTTHTHLHVRNFSWCLVTALIQHDLQLTHHKQHTSK